MKTMKTLAILAMAFGLASAAQAQELKSANFLDNYLYGYRLNPSVTPTETVGFVGIAAGNISLDAQTNFGLSNFLFPLADGRLVTGLNSAIPQSQFPGGLEKINRVNANLSENILSIGASGKKGAYNHFEINLVSQNGVNVPRSLFEAFKNNNTTGNYTVEGLNFNTAEYLELAFGRSKRNKNLAIGWTFKGLVGLVRADANIDMEINTAGDNMYLRSLGTLKASVSAISIGTDSEGYYDPSTLTPDLKNLKPSGLGAAVDIGASYYLLNDKIILGAAVRNLGMMKWTDNLYGQNSGNKVIIDMNNTDNLSKEMQDMLKFKPVSGSAAGKLSMLPFSFNLSAKYKPVKLVTVGVVGTMYKYNGYTTKDIRFGAAFTPLRQFNLAGTYSIGDQGQEVGLAASVRLLGINIYAGIDAIRFRVSPQYIPLDPVSTTVNAGVAIAFGKATPAKATKKASSKKKKADNSKPAEQAE